MRLLPDGFDSVDELYADDQLGQLVVSVEAAPTVLCRLGEFEDHGERRLVGEASLGSHGTVRAFYYTALVEDQEYSPLRPVVDWLDYNGYTLVTKPTKEFTAAMGPTPWGGGRSRAIWTPRSPSM